MENVYLKSAFSFALTISFMAGLGEIGRYDTEAFQSKRKATSARSHFVKANGLRTHYLEWGNSGSPIVLVHGLYDTAEVWAAAAPLLATKHRVFAPDRRGSGFTDRPADGYDYKTLAIDLAAFIQSLNLESVVLVAHSFGGGTAMTLTATQPKLIQSLILIEGGFFPKPVTSPEGARPSPPCEATPAECSRLAALEKTAKEYDPEPLYSRISMPTLLILGEPARIPPGMADIVRQAQEHVSTVASKKLPQGKMAIVKKAEHWVQKDQPKELVKEVEEFLNSVSLQNKQKVGGGRLGK